MQRFPAQFRQPDLRLPGQIILIVITLLPMIASVGDSSRNTQADVLAIGLPNGAGLVVNARW